MFTHNSRLKYSTSGIAFAMAVAISVTGCGGNDDTVSSSGSGSSTTAASGGKSLDLVAFAVPKVAFDQLIPAFQETAAGKGVEVAQSYGASGDQSRAVEAGQPADVVNFSLEPDLTRLVKAKKVSADWSKGSQHGIVSNSVVTIVVREGNPKGIKSWSDLLKPGVEVVTPNPFSSGSAKWNLLAPYASESAGGKKQAKGLKYIKSLLEHVKTQPKSGREASQTFLQGNADALLTYENEALYLKKQGEKVDFVTPSDTLLIENPFAVTSDSKNSAAALAFKKFVFSDVGQKIWAEAGFRPTSKAVAAKYRSKFPKPSGSLFTIKQLGGWSKLNDSLFDPDNGSVAKLYSASGAETGK